MSWHNRLWFRVSWAIGDKKFVAMSFLLDTGAPKHMYLSNRAMAALEENGLVCVDDDMDIQYVNLAGRKCPIEMTPTMHAPANLIGLKLLKQLGLRLWEGSPHVTFEECVRVLGTNSFKRPIDSSSR
jgi:U3 small nucleolar RNA-associated protein 25